MKINKISEFPASRTRVLFAAAAVAFLPFAQTASAVNFQGSYSSTFASGDPFEAGGQDPGANLTELPSGWRGLDYATSSIAVTGAMDLPNAQEGGASVGQGFYYTTDLVAVNGAGDTGIGTLTTTAPKAYVLELFNDTLVNYGTIRPSFTAEIFQAGGAGNDKLQLQIFVSTVALTTFSQLSSNTGWSAPIDFTANGGVVGSQTGTSSTLNITPNINYSPGRYLYVRFLDTTDNSSGIALNLVAVTARPFVAVPEPSTWVAAGLLLGCVGYGSIRRKAKADAEALPVTVA